MWRVRGLGPGGVGGGRRYPWEDLYISELGGAIVAQGFGEVPGFQKRFCWQLVRLSLTCGEGGSGDEASPPSDRPWVLGFFFASRRTPPPACSSP